MANSQRGEVGFEALDRDWTIKLGTNAMCEIETALGKGINEIAGLLGDSSSFTLGTMRLVFLHGMRAFHSEITKEQVGDILDDIGMERAVSIMTDAFVFSAQPKEEGAAAEGKANPRKAKAA